VINAFTQQWPHSMPLRPGGATCPIGREEIEQARAAVDDYADWYGPTILGGTLDEWADVERAEQFHHWIQQRPHSLISLYTRYATEAAELHTVGRGSQNLLSGGLYRQPRSPDRPLIPGGVLVGAGRGPAAANSTKRRAEHGRFSWFADEGPRHPTQVGHPGPQQARVLRWATAHPATAGRQRHAAGPLAELVLAEDPSPPTSSPPMGSAYLRHRPLDRGAASLTLMRGGSTT
jgi:hypothetical protein